MKNKKLIELGILSEDENSGVSAISLVENPAIEVDFLYFRAENFVKPSGGESKDEFISRCIPVLRNEGKPEDQAVAICYSYWENRMEAFEELDVLGYKTRFFYICPLADETFKNLVELAPLLEEEYTGMIRSAAVIADRVFEIEKNVKEAGIATREQMKEALVLVSDFYDIIYEIDEEISDAAGETVVHNVQYMDGHLETIASFLPEEMSIDVSGLPPYVDEIGKKKDSFEKVSFDWDDTLSTVEGKALFKKYLEAGADLFIITARNTPGDDIKSFIESIGLPSSKVYATGSNKAKIEKVLELGISKHIDNNSDVVSELGSKGEKFKNKDKYEDIVLNTVLEAAAKLGWANEEFANAQAAPFAGSSLEELRQNLQMQPEAKGFTVYKYEGPIGSNSRDYCRQMIGLNRWYTYADIETMEGIAVNAGFGLRGESTYSIWKYKGGPNCKHRWQKYYVTPDKSENKGPAPGRAGEKPIDMENNGYATPERNWVNRSGFSALRFADEEQKVVVGPAMIPNMEIPRRDDDGDIYYVKFSEDTIKEIMMKFMKEARTNDTNQDHNENAAAGSYVYESWLVEDPENDKANLKYGFNVPKGTWMVSMKVDDKEVWKRIKNGELRGFSVEGLFSNMEEIQGLKKYLKVVKILKD